MAILSSPMASARPQILASIKDAHEVRGTIFITSVTPKTPENPASLALLPQVKESYSVDLVNGVWTITLQPPSQNFYPVVYTLTLAPPAGFPFAEPLGQLSLRGQNYGFLLDSPTLQMYKGSPPQTSTQEYNLALRFFDEKNNQIVEVGDPTIVFEPPS